VGAEAPDFVAVNIASEDSVRLSDYQGEVVLLNLWATWCAPCRQEMPSMERLYEELGPEGLRIVAVSVDPTRRVVHEFVDEYGLTFDILHDQSQRVDVLYQTTGLPESFVIDRHGVIVKKTYQMEWDHPAQVAFLRTLLGTDDTQPTNLTEDQRTGTAEASAAAPGG
jgi:peroxiredoxin